jgi:hypothetical protein
MLSALKEEKVDLIVALTEGLVGDIAKGSGVCLVSGYVDTPLCWAISTGADSVHNTTEDLREGTFAISRNFSGSHLMTCVLASQRSWDMSKVI